MGFDRSSLCEIELHTHRGQFQYLWIAGLPEGPRRVTWCDGREEEKGQCVKLPSGARRPYMADHDRILYVYFVLHNLPAGMHRILPRKSRFNRGVEQLQDGRTIIIAMVIIIRRTLIPAATFVIHPCLSSEVGASV